MIFDWYLKYKYNYNNLMILILYIVKKKRNIKVDLIVMLYYFLNFNIYKIDNFFFEMDKYVIYICICVVLGFVDYVCIFVLGF